MPISLDLNKPKSNSSKKVTLESLLKKRNNMTALVNDKPIIYSVPLISEELILEVNHHFKKDFKDEDELYKYMMKQKNNIVYLYKKYLIDWKKTTNNVRVFAPNKSEINLNVDAELVFTREDKIIKELKKVSIK